MDGSEHPARTWLIGGVAIAVIVTATYRFVIPKPLPPPPENTRSADVKRIINGHTIKIDPDDRVIYAGIRAPFRHDPLGEAATERNRELVEDKRIRMRFDEEKKDKDGRWLAYVFADGEMVNKELVEEGLAYVRLRAGEHRFAEELLAAQNEARRARRGVWQFVTPSSERRYPADRKHATFHRPDCADVSNTRPENETVFSSKKKAFDAGFAPCGHCLP